jgi:hypothetical protein
MGMNTATPSEQWMASLFLSAAHGDADSHHALGKIFSDPQCPQQDLAKAQYHFEWADLLDPNR